MNIIANLTLWLSKTSTIFHMGCRANSRTLIDFSETLFVNDIIPVLPELFLVLTTIVFLSFGVIYTTSTIKKYPILHTNITWLALFSLIFTFSLLVNSSIGNAVIFYNTLFFDDFSFFFKTILVLGAFFSIAIAMDYNIQESLNAFEYIILILLSSCSMLFLVSSEDFISMYLAIELQSLCFYVLAASKRNSEFSTEAGLKYFILGAFSSGILLFGCSLIYGFTGITNFSELAYLITNTDTLRGCELGMIFLMIGFLFKLTVVPFHLWAPDVYEGAPTSVTAFFAITPKASILAIFIRIFFESFYDFMVPWQKILIFCCISSMVLGSFAAMSQKKLKRLLAFSSIGHVGYILVGFCCGTLQGLHAMLIYLVIYMVMSVGLFAIILSPVRRDYMACGFVNQTQFGVQSFNDVWLERKSSLPFNVRGPMIDLADGSSLTIQSMVRQPKGLSTEQVRFNTLCDPISRAFSVQRIKYITDFALISKTKPILAITLTVLLFSIAGIPPLAGFYSKAFLFFAAMSSNMFLLAVVGVITSVISCFYYIRLIKLSYFETPTTWCSFSRMNVESAFILGTCFFFISFFMAEASPLYTTTHKAALSFIG